MRFSTRTLLALPFFLTASFVATADEQAGARLCHVTNAGFIIAHGEETVLIDALLDVGLNGYAKPSADLEAGMEAGDTPLDNVVAVIATHEHYDHFNPLPILNHMRANPDTHYVLTPDSLEILFDNGLPRDREHVRVHALYPDGDGPETLTFGDVGVEVYRVSHGSGRGIQNVGVRVTMGGRTFFHPGDMFSSPEELAESGIAGLDVDYLLLPHWYTMDEDRIPEIAASFNARHVVPMHLPMKGVERQWITNYGGYDKVIEDSFGLVDNVVKLTEEMECLEVG